ERKLVFGRDYILPKPFDPRLITEIPPAIAKAAMDSGVATNPITDYDKYRDELSERMGNDNKLVKLLIKRAKTDPKRVVYTEADRLNVLNACRMTHEEGIALPTLLGNKEVIRELKNEIGFDPELQIIDPTTADGGDRRHRLPEK